MKFRVIDSALLGSAVLALSMVSGPSAARADAIASASISISNFTFAFSEVPPFAGVAVGTMANLGASVNNGNITPTNSLGTHGSIRSIASGSLSGTTTITQVGDAEAFVLNTVSASASSTAELGSNETAQSTAILDQEIDFNIVGSTTLSVSGSPTTSLSVPHSIPINSRESAIAEVGLDLLLIDDSNRDVLAGRHIQGDSLAYGFPTSPDTGGLIADTIFPTLTTGSYTLQLLLGATATAVDTEPLPVLTPEPSSFAMALAGLLGLGFLRRTRNRVR